VFGRATITLGIGPHSSLLNITSFAKPEVYNIYRSVVRREPSDVYRIFREVWSVVFEIRERIDKQARKQTDIQTC